MNAALAAVVAVSVVLACATWARFYLMMSVGERIIADLRKAVFTHVLTLSPAFFDGARTGEIGSRLTNDTEQIRQVIGFGFSMFLRNGLMMLGALVLLFLTSPKLAALIVLVDRGPTVQRDLAAATGADKAGIMRVVDDLERRGLVVRKAVPADRRARAVEITAEGIELIDAAHVVAEPLAERLIAELGPGEPERLTDLLTRFAYPTTAWACADRPPAREP